MRDDGFTPHSQIAREEPNLNCGGYQTAIRAKRQFPCEGSFTGTLHRWTVSDLLTWALDRNATNFDGVSYATQHYSPVETRQCVGLMVNTATLSFDAASGDVNLDLDIVGKSVSEMDASDAPAYSDFTCSDEVPFRFQHAVIKVPSDGTPLAEVESATIRVENNTAQGPVGSDYVIAWAQQGRQRVTVDMRLRYTGSTYNDAIRDETNLSMDITLTHPSGGTNGIVSITIPCLQIDDAPETGGPSEVIRQDVTGVARYDLTNDQISWSVSDGA